MQGVKAFLNLGGNVAPPDAEQCKSQVENTETVQQRTPEQRKKLKSKRQELSQITKELREAKRGAERSEQLEQVKRTKKKKQEVFRLENELRAAKERQAGGRSGEMGALPDFVIIGAQKSGTTSLYHLLTKHPYVEPAAFKELQYFDLLFEEGIEWYRQCFLPPQQKNGRQTITGEGTPSYLFHPLAPERMATVIPQARLIALLRNPVDRAYSDYHHRVSNGQETRSFEEAIEVEEKRLRGEREKVFEDKNYGIDPASSEHLPKSINVDQYLSRGIYVNHLLRWSTFFKEEQMLILKSEDFFERPQETLKLMLDFLDLPDWKPEGWEIRKRGGYEREMDPPARRRLEDLFEPHNQRLYEYLGVDFGW